MTAQAAIRIALNARDHDHPITITCRDGKTFTGTLVSAHDQRGVILTGPNGPFGFAMGEIADVEIADW